MSITRVQGNSVNSSSGTTSQTITLPIGVTQGNLLVASVATGNNSVSFTGPDSSWTQVTLNQPAGSNATIETSIWYMVVDIAHAGGTSWTWTIPSAHTMYICIEEWNSSTGWPANPIDKSANGDTVGTPTQSTTPSSGTTATTAQANELWIASLAYKGSSQTESSITAGWIKDLEATLANNNTMTMLYKVVSSTGAASCQYSIGTAKYWAGCIVTFKNNTAVGNPALSTSPTSLSFSATVSGANPASQNDTLSEVNGVATAWTSSITYTSGSGWLSTSPTSGSLGASGNTTIVCSCTTGALSAGTYAATITFTATTGGAQATISVTFTVTTSRITSPGKFGVYANGSGTASFDHLRVTQYPDPSLALGSITSRVNSTSITWDDVLPNSDTFITMGVSTDGVNWTDVTNANGGPIPGITTSSDPVTDTFFTNTASNYTSTFRTGGGAGTWTYDTPNSRIVATGGNKSAFLNSSISGQNVQLVFDMDESDFGGVFFNWIDASNMYMLEVHDGSAASSPNTVTLSKIVSNTPSTLGTAAISWTRGNLLRFVVTNLSGALTVSLDGTQIIAATDGSPLGSGKYGLMSTSGTNRFYSLWIILQGQLVSGTPSGNIANGMFLYTKATLTSNDPTVTPALTDQVLSVRGASIHSGAMIDQLHNSASPFAEYISNELNTLAKQSTTTNGIYLWNIDQNKNLVFLAGYHSPAPWVVSPKDVQYANVQNTTKTASGDTFRNSQTLLGVIDVIPFGPLTFLSSGTETSWSMGVPLAIAPTITVNGQLQTVGVKGVDSGKTFYWEYNNNGVTLDTNLTAFPSGTVITFAGQGLYNTYTTIQDTTNQAARAAIETGTSGIVEEVETVNGILLSSAGNIGQSYLNWYMRENVELDFDTLRSGLDIGQTISVWLPQHGLYNKQLVVFDIICNVQSTNSDGTPFYVWSIKASDGPYLGPWVDILSRSVN